MRVAHVRPAVAAEHVDVGARRVAEARPGQRLDDAVGDEAELLLHAPALPVALVVARPDRVEAQVGEGVLEQGRSRLGHDALPPEGPADPVAQLRLPARPREVGRRAKHEGDRAHGQVPRAPLEHDGIALRHGEHLANHPAALLDALVRGPSGARAHVGVARVAEERVGVGLPPGSQGQARGLEVLCHGCLQSAHHSIAHPPPPRSQSWPFGT